MGTIPACELPYRAFRLTEKGLEADPAANQEPPVRSPVLPQGFWWSRGFLLRGVLPTVAVIAIYAVVKLRLASKRRSKR